MQRLIKLVLNRSANK